jgi:tetratricopeptide (TPR) repeat protein
MKSVQRLICLLVVTAWAHAATLAQGLPDSAPAARSPALRPDAYERFADAEACVAREDLVCARALIDEVLALPDLDDYERAHYWNFRGFIELNAGDLPQSAASYENVLRLANLPVGVREQALLSLAQVYDALEHYERSLETLDVWLGLTSSPSAASYYQIAAVAFRGGQLDRALASIETALATADSVGVEPDAEWYELLVALCYERDDFVRIVETLEFMYDKWPKPRYRNQLVGAYAMLNETARQLELLEAGFADGTLSDSGQFINLVILLYRDERPAEALDVLDRGIADGVIEVDEEIQRLYEQLENARELPEPRIPRFG